MQWPDLREVLAGIRWAIPGAVATRLYMPERATRDLDIVVLAEDAEQAGERLVAAGFSPLGPLAIGGSAWAAPDGTPVDLIEAREPWWPEALAEASTNLDPAGAPVVPFPYLVFMKLLASRLQGLADVSRMLGAATEPNPNRAGARAVIREHAPDLSQDLESLITLGKLETESAPDEGRVAMVQGVDGTDVEVLRQRHDVASEDLRAAPNAVHQDERIAAAGLDHPVHVLPAGDDAHLRPHEADPQRGKRIDIFHGLRPHHRAVHLHGVAGDALLREALQHALAAARG